MPRILVIDDDTIILEIIEEILEQSGYQVVVALSGEEGIRLLNNAKPNLVITDINMPIMDGNAVAEYVRSSSDFKDVPKMVSRVKYCDNDETDVLLRAASCFWGGIDKVEYGISGGGAVLADYKVDKRDYPHNLF